MISTRTHIAEILKNENHGLITASIHKKLVDRRWHTEKNTLVTIISQMAREGHLHTTDKQCECCDVKRKAYKLSPMGINRYLEAA